MTPEVTVRSLKDSLAPVVTVLGFLALVVGLFVTRVEFVDLRAKVDRLEDRLYHNRTPKAQFTVVQLGLTGDTSSWSKSPARSESQPPQDQAGPVDWLVLGAGATVFGVCLTYLWRASLPAPPTRARVRRAFDRMAKHKRAWHRKAGTP